jgi:hypothetical protein
VRTENATKSLDSSSFFNIPYKLALETMENNLLSMTNFLINQEALYIRSLVSTQLNDFTNFVVFLYSSVATKVLLESLANALHIQIVS